MLAGPFVLRESLHRNEEDPFCLRFLCFRIVRRPFAALPCKGAQFRAEKLGNRPPASAIPDYDKPAFAN